MIFKRVAYRNQSKSKTFNQSDGTLGQARTPDRVVRNRSVRCGSSAARRGASNPAGRGKPIDTSRTRQSVSVRRARAVPSTGCMARPERFELPTAWFVARYSIQTELRARGEGCEVSGGAVATVNRIAAVMVARFAVFSILRRGLRAPDMPDRPLVPVSRLARKSHQLSSRGRGDAAVTRRTDRTSAYALAKA